MERGGTRVYIIGMIFKIIGILLLILLGIVLVLLLSVLLVPIRYKFAWEKQEENPHHVRVKLSWLLHILALSVEYQEQVRYVIRVFGIPIKKGTFQQDEETEQEEDIFENVSDDFSSNVSSDEQKKEDSHKSSEEKKSYSILEEQKNEEKASATEDNAQQDVKDNISETNSNEMFSAKKNKTTEKENTKIERLDIEADSQEFDIALPSPSKKKSPFWKRWKEKIKKFVAFIKKIPNFFKSLFYKVRELWQNVDGKKSHVMGQIHTVVDFWQAKENQKGKQLIFAKGKKMVTHIFPKKCKGFIRFGFSNPATTGQVLAVISIVGGLAGIIPNLKPDFSKETLEGKFSCRGRLQIGYLLWQGLSLWFHEDMKRVKDNFEKVRRAF